MNSSSTGLIDSVKVVKPKQKQAIKIIIEAKMTEEQLDALLSEISRASEIIGINLESIKNEQLKTK